MPHAVPHMVQLKKFVVSEDTVFLLLQYAEGEAPRVGSSAPSSPALFLLLLHPPFLSDLAPDRCLMEMSVCHRSLF